MANMTATLSSVNLASRVFVYNLTHPYYAWTPLPPFSEPIYILSMYTRPGFTKLSGRHGGEIYKSLGIESHAHILGSYGYTWRVTPEFVRTLSDEELLMCIDELVGAGDDVSIFMEELEKR